MSTMAIIHAIVGYLGDPVGACRQWSGVDRAQKTRLLAHVYSVKNVYTGLIRAFAAYHITNPELYSLAQATFVGVLFLYGTELLIWKTTGPKECLIPLVQSAGVLLWMYIQRDYYLDGV